MIMEMARAFTTAKVQLPHSIIFAAITAEEQGLLGSAYLAQHPPVPIGQLNLDLNFDEILPFGQGDQFSASGARRTSFFPTIEAVAKQFGYSIPDTGGGYYRSDHFSFAHAGVPASPSARAASTKDTTKPGHAPKPCTSRKTTITRSRTTFTKSGISPATQPYAVWASSWDGSSAPNHPSNGTQETSSKPPARPPVEPAKF
jgi:Zn-dependent M28 family amino/carboxypeptidase